MSLLDLAAWAVLFVLAVSAVAGVVIVAMLPGMIAKHRNHPWAQGVSVAGWVSLIFGFALWPLALVWAYVDAPTPKQADKAP